jgi:hypothetical protein
MSRDGSLRSSLLRIAGWAEQEVRAHPRLYKGFYGTVNRSSLLRSTAGRLKHGVRSRGDDARVRVTADPTQAAARRLAAVAARLGLVVDDS